MKYIKRYNVFKESTRIDLSMGYTFNDILESLSVFQDNLLTSIKAVEVNFDKELHYNVDDNSMNIDLLVNNSKFITSLQNKGLKLSKVEETDDFETFISNNMKFLLIFKQDENELMNPIYIIIQSMDASKDDWGRLKLFKVNDSIKKFYDTLSSKTIEMKYKGKSYIYTTSNSGSEWYLSNVGNSNMLFKKYLRKEDLKNLTNDNKDIKISIM